VRCRAAEQRDCIGWFLSPAARRPRRSAARGRATSEVELVGEWIEMAGGGVTAQIAAVDEQSPSSDNGSTIIYKQLIYHGGRVRVTWIARPFYKQLILRATLPTGSGARGCDINSYDVCTVSTKHKRLSSLARMAVASRTSAHARLRKIARSKSRVRIASGCSRQPSGRARSTKPAHVHINDATV
jgi:hypothetical protein